MNQGKRDELRAIGTEEGFVALTPEYIYSVQQTILDEHFPTEAKVAMGKVHRDNIDAAIGASRHAASYAPLVEGDPRLNQAIYLSHRLASGHALTNANKRTAFWMLLLIVQSSEFPRTLDVSQEEATLVLRDVEAGHVGVARFAEWVFDNLKDYDEVMGDYPDNARRYVYGDVPVSFPDEESERVARCSLESCDEEARGFLNIFTKFGYRRHPRDAPGRVPQNRCKKHKKSRQSE